MRTVGADNENALRVDVIGHMWWWEFRYPDLSIDSANELHLPTNQPVEFHITSDDVIHSFWIPEFGWKMDAIPGHTSDMALTPHETGIFDGACAEYCGQQHAWMRIKAFVQSPADFQEWVDGQRSPPQSSSAEARGREIFLSNTCVNCHAIEGTAANGVVGPQLTHVGSRTVLGAGVVENTPENMARFISQPQEVKPGIHMPGFNFSPDDLQALVAYLESLK
jgi:cytochrome c oxidase subunit 2